MKKTTLLIFFLIVSFTYSQTNSTGQVTLSSTTGLEMAVQIDVTATEVTISLGGPDDRWLAVGFGVSSMTNGGDVVVFDGTDLTDRTFVGVGSMPTLDANQDWTVTNIEYSTFGFDYVGIEATRPLTTSDPNDYDFNLTDTSINLVWARSNGAIGSGSFSLSNHGGTNRGSLVTGFTLGVADFEIANFKITPNPVTSSFKIDLPESVGNARVEVYDVLGKMIYKDEITEFNSLINSSSWNNGVYMVRVSSGNISQTKRLIKQ